MAGIRRKILVADDDPNTLTLFRYRLKAMGFDILTASDGREALQVVRKEAPSLIFLDLLMPEMGGLDVLRALKREGLEITAIVITAYGTIEAAVEAMKEGAYDFITKPVDPKHLEVVIAKALEREDLRQQNQYLREELSEIRPSMILGETPAMKRVLQIARRAAESNTTILLLGESGTGKEVLARAIHHWSPRQARPFTVVNCVALSEQLLESELFGHEKGAFTGAYQTKKGKFELADGGTIFLDEIGDLKPSLQAKLLRVLQEHEFERVGGTRTIRTDIRVIAAANRNLERAVREGSFREDLYYRLNVVSITLPPLRERKEDLPAFIEYFLKKSAKETKKPLKRVAPEAMQCLLAYSWPGNVRELENIIERAVVLSEGEEIHPDDLPAQLIAGPMPAKARERPYHEAVKEFKRQLIVNALQRAQGNQTKAAELLGLQRTYLTKLVKVLNLKAVPSSSETGPS